MKGESIEDQNKIKEELMWGTTLAKALFFLRLNKVCVYWVDFFSKNCIKLKKEEGKKLKLEGVIEQHCNIIIIAGKNGRFILYEPMRWVGQIKTKTIKNCFSKLVREFFI